MENEARRDGVGDQVFKLGKKKKQNLKKIKIKKFPPQRSLFFPLKRRLVATGSNPAHSIPWAFASLKEEIKNKYFNGSRLVW